MAARRGAALSVPVGVGASGCCLRSRCSNPVPKLATARACCAGGEGATAREVLRHKSVEKVVMVDIDQVGRRAVTAQRALGHSAERRPAAHLCPAPTCLERCCRWCVTFATPTLTPTRLPSSLPSWSWCTMTRARSWRPTPASLTSSSGTWQTRWRTGRATSCTRRCVTGAPLCPTHTAVPCRPSPLILSS